MELMAQDDWLADRFEEHRSHLRAVAYRMLGSASDADDAVQEAWIRLSRSDSSAVENLGGWLTTVVARVALDMLLRVRRGAKNQLARCRHRPLITAHSELSLSGPPSSLTP
jgi:DNA-directed RNA polymerase specialized sigma24 family protein